MNLDTLKSIGQFNHKRIAFFMRQNLNLYNIIIINSNNIKVLIFYLKFYH